MHPCRVQDWLKRGLPSVPNPKHQNTRLVDLEVFRQWVKDNPHELAGIPADRLALLLDDGAVIKAIGLCPKRGHTKRVRQVFPVTCEYRSIKDAAAANHISYFYLCNALKKAKRQGKSRAAVHGSEFLVEVGQ